MKILEVKSNISAPESMKKLAIRINEERVPETIAFFDIDQTLAHLEPIYREAIAGIFPEVDKDELTETFVRGFKLGNSFREFDRMYHIYEKAAVSWKDPEIYIKERLNEARGLIDSPGNLAHTIAVEYIKAYGQQAAKIAEEKYKTHPEFFNLAKIGPLYKLLEIYKRSGFLMFGFTANTSYLVSRIAPYLGLDEYFLDIGTDEMMEGGGKEVAIERLLGVAQSQGFRLEGSELIFVGDSIRGDIGSGVKFCQKDPGFKAKGILVLEDAKALLEMRHLVNTDPYINSIIRFFRVFGLVVSDVPVNQDGLPSLLAREMDKFLFRL
jgi:phosphoglycolate phosphatase-like HAD superfamily hydrolase